MDARFAKWRAVIVIGDRLPSRGCIEANTYFGKTAQLVQEAHTENHFQQAVLKIGKYLIILAVALVAVIITVGFFRGEPMLYAKPPKDPVLLFALILTVAAIPVAMGVRRDDGDGQWQFLGVLPLFDPPRDDAKETVKTAGEMGVTIKMVTGDALAIAKETAKKLNMGANILDASSLGDSKKEESAEVAESIDNADGFAQVFPEHKYHIVDVLQKRGHIVGMTGDGLNDAPALKKADCGIVVSGAMDAARAAASIVLVAPGLSVIIDAIKESRKIFQRMNFYAIYRIAETQRVERPFGRDLPEASPPRVFNSTE